MSLSETHIEPSVATRRWWHDDHLLAYVVIEQGRLLCEQLLEAGDAGLESGLRTAHQGLGLAGYTASDDIPADVRLALLELVHAHRTPAIPPADADLERVLMFALHAREIVARCLRDPECAPEMQLAHGQVCRALTALTRLVTGARRAELTSRAGAMGLFDPRWQREHLAPVPAAVPLVAPS
jgi:hypothetical protein